MTILHPTRPPADALPDGHCPIVQRVTIAEVRDPVTGRPRTLEAVDGSSLEIEIFRWQLQQLMTGGGPLLGPVRYRQQHRARCPLCGFRRLPGPRVFGWWIPETWQADTRYDSVSADRGLETFANLAEAHARTSGRLRVMTRQRRIPGAGAVVVQDLQVPVDGRQPDIGPVFVSGTTQVWLWDDLEAARHRDQPDRIILSRAGRAAPVTGSTEIARIVAAARRPAPCPASTASDTFRTTLLDGHTIRWIPGDGTLMSIQAPDSTRPAYRLRPDGSTEALPDAPRGLVVLGTHRGDRPALHRLGDWLPDYAPLAGRLRASHGTTI
ncbi:hypothetical protein [Catenuloplanes japonicus]|uniref:hypothetical protein n=1 Tax=Catenuloplanes japonicus TaxID=33876 RepID=UPI000AAF7DB8|nr:hypothetical protein [Catenuloplanes japonicus]